MCPAHYNATYKNAFLSQQRASDANIYPQNADELKLLANFDLSKRKGMNGKGQGEQTNKAEILQRLQRDIAHLQGSKPASNTQYDFGLGVIQRAFSQGVFPLGAIHEFVATTREEAVSSTGFLTGLLKTLMGTEATVLWISSSQNLFSPALAFFGLAAHRIIRIQLTKPKDILWTVEEALKCGALAAVIGEIADLDFTASRRLQLAVENSKTTGFLLRCTARPLSTTACTARWRITPLPSAVLGDLPGIGYPRWQVELLKIRNGHPGQWNVHWQNDQFRVEHPDHRIKSQPRIKTA